MFGYKKGRTQRELELIRDQLTELLSVWQHGERSTTKLEAYRRLISEQLRRINQLIALSEKIHKLVQEEL